MHPKIEKLIEMALDDGQVTDKEREIILRKAEKNGLDVDEVEMHLEGMISSKNLYFESKILNKSKIDLKENNNFKTNKKTSIENIITHK